MYSYEQLGRMQKSPQLLSSKSCRSTPREGFHFQGDRAKTKARAAATRPAAHLSAADAHGQRQVSQRCQSLQVNSSCAAAV
ncbi:Rrna Methyltransferase 2 [Manis pentadactyla]|nr:Rrna Methyltransferase 2 [Manis pentadactyla]